MTKCFLLIDVWKTFVVHPEHTVGLQFLRLFPDPTRQLSILAPKFPLYFQFGI